MQADEDLVLSQSGFVASFPWSFLMCSLIFLLSACKLEDRYLNFVVSAEFPLFLMVYVFPFACGLTSHGVEVS